MAIQVRRGNEADFDASKMLPGELAVSLDARYVRMCFAPGIVLRMATYDSFEADMSQIKSILAECKSIQSAVQRIQSEVNSKASLTIEYANSAKQSADRAYSEAERAKTYANNAEAVTGVQIATKDRAGLIKGGDNHIAEDGTLMLITETTDTTMPNSYDGRLLVKKIKGVCEQGENPSPTSPQEIKKTVVSGVKTHGKNLLPYTNNYKYSASGITVEAVGDGYSYKVYGTATGHIAIQIPMSIASKKVCTFSSNYVATNNSNVSLYYTENGSTTVKALAPAKTIDLSKNTISTLAIFVSSGATVNYVAKVQLEEGTVATEYEPYTESSITLSKPIDLYGIGDVQDVITPKQIKRKFVKISNYDTFTISPYGNKEKHYGYVLAPSGSANFETSGNILCSHLPLIDGGSHYKGSEIGVTLYPTAIGICVDIPTVTEVKSWLVENEVEFICQTATETTEELPLADQVALNSLATYDGITYLEFDAEVQPTFEGEYGTSKVGGYTLEGMLAGRNGELMGKDYANRITALETAMVNNI